MLYKDRQRHTTAWSTGTARIAAPTCRTASSRTAACAATTTAGCSTRPASAWTSPSRRSRIPRPVSRTASRSSPTRSRRRPACSGPTWARSRRRSCRPGSRSPGRTASCRSSSPRCRATGSSARRTPSTRCTSSGCTATGHASLQRRLKGPTPPTHLKIGFDEFEYGFVYRRILEGQSEQDELWTVGRTCLWPNCLFTGDHFEWRVPIDDDHTLSVGWFFDRVPEEMEPFTAGAHPVLVLRRS